MKLAPKAVRKEDALALERRHSSGIGQGLTGRQPQPGRGRCGVQIANKLWQLCLDQPFRRGTQLLPSSESIRPMAKVVKGHSRCLYLNRSLYLWPSTGVAPVLAYLACPSR